MSDPVLEVEILEGDMYAKGDSATIKIGKVVTGEPGTEAKVTNAGTIYDAILNFLIPQGPKGDTGKGIKRWVKTHTQGLVDYYRITFTDDTYFEYTITNADAGSAYTKVETDDLLDKKINKSSVIDDYTSHIADEDKSKLASLFAIKTFKLAVDTVTGLLNSLTTEDKTSLVAAINELVTGLGTKVDTSDYDKKMTSLDNLINTKSNAKYYEASVNGADFTINSSVPLTPGTEHKVHFAASDNTSDARLSVDNGTTFYNVDGCKAIALSGEYLTLVFDGSKFVVMTGFGPVALEYEAEEEEEVENE